MKMTEADARTKVCPAVGGGDRGDCVASACMAWRWVPKASSWVEGGEKVQEITRAEGYCGLAGVWS